ncbi:MAG: hypothetical protein ACRYG7_06945 [Janthinobacterium lividum]
MKPLTSLLLPGLFWSQLANAQGLEPKGTLVVNENLVSRFISQTDLLSTSANKMRFKKKIAPVEDWLLPAPGDKWVTYYLKGDTLVFYQSGRTVTLFRCRLTNAARYAQTVPLLASTKKTLFPGKYKTHNVFTVTEAIRRGQYTLILTFQDNHIRRLRFNVDTSSW